MAIAARLMQAVIAGEGVDAGPATGIVEVRFRHAAPRDTALHATVFGGPPRFGAPHDTIVLRRDTLALALEPRPKMLETVTDAFLRHRIGMLARYTPGVSTSTALAVRTVLGTGICSKEFIARALGASPRQLQRLLAREGTTYEDVLDGVHREMACRLLSETTVPIATIAGMLDFASAAALTLAVRRWTGMTPSGFRNRFRAERPAAADATAQA